MTMKKDLKNGKKEERKAFQLLEKNLEKQMVIFGII